MTTTWGLDKLAPGEAPDALAVALAAEHVAVFGYGVVGAHLDAAGKATAADAELAHRNRRDALILRLSQDKTEAPAAAAAYTLPFPVTDRASAIRLAVTLEAGTAAAWKQALGFTTESDRKLALDALTDCAVRATRWRQAGGITPVAVQFPGNPD
jgi:Domain of unknown function (DUF4439)